MKEDTCAKKNSQEGNFLKHKDKNSKESESTEKRYKKEKDKKEGLSTCIKCDYVTKKQATLEKHINMKHGDPMCKECNIKAPSCMGLLKHIAEENGKEEVNEDEDMVKNSQEKDKEDEKRNYLCWTRLKFT